VTLRRSAIAPQFPACNKKELHRQTCRPHVSSGMRARMQPAEHLCRAGCIASPTWRLRACVGQMAAGCGDRRGGGRDERHLAGRARRRAERTSWIGSLDPALELESESHRRGPAVNLPGTCWRRAVISHHNKRVLRFATEGPSDSSLTSLVDVNKYVSTFDYVFSSDFVEIAKFIFYNFNFLCT